MNQTLPHTPRFVITSGEPAGIGPDLVLQLAQHNWPQQLIIIGNAQLLKQRAQQLKLNIQIQPYHPKSPALPSKAGQLTLLDLPLAEPVQAGQLNPQNAPYVLQMLKTAVTGCLNNEFQAMITGPVHKGILNQAGIPFSGHTELLAQYSGTDQVVMMLATPGLRVPLVTTHLPLRQVPDAITPERLSKVLHILHHSLTQQFGIQAPTIYVAGLNPHAGEDGHLGREEIDIINPTLNSLKKTLQPGQIIGALPADTLFTPKYLQNADAIVAMYHDQGLTVLKHKGFGKAVNITLGLPFIRTSVDHGTALDIAGQGIAKADSFHYAIEIAQQMMAQPTNTADTP